MVAFASLESGICDRILYMVMENRIDFMVSKLDTYHCDTMIVLMKMIFKFRMSSDVKLPSIIAIVDASTFVSVKKFSGSPGENLGVGGLIYPWL